MTARTLEEAAMLARFGRPFRRKVSGEGSPIALSDPDWIRSARFSAFADAENYLIHPRQRGDNPR